MALADTAAALVGQKVGATEYNVYDNHRTLEGSLVFFALSGLSVWGSGHRRKDDSLVMLLVALVAAIMSLMPQSPSASVGPDNLFHSVHLLFGPGQNHDWVLRICRRIEGLILGVFIIAAFVSNRPSHTFWRHHGIGRRARSGIGRLGMVLSLLAFYLLHRDHPPPGQIRVDLDEVFPNRGGFHDRGADLWTL